MMFHDLRIRLANWLLGTGMEWRFGSGTLKDTPYIRLCKLMQERSIEYMRRVNEMSRREAERSLEITKMHKAFARKNRQIAKLKAQLRVKP